MTNLETNVGFPERILSILGGAYLLFDTISKQKANMPQAIAGTYLLLRGVTGFCLAYDQLAKATAGRNVNIRTSMTVNRPRHQVYAHWRRLENLPRFMKHLKRVNMLDERHSEWTAAVAGDIGTLSWRSEIVKDDPGDTLSWRSLPHSTIQHAGKVTFRDADNAGTKVNVVFSYHAPMGVMGEKAGRLLNPVFENMVRNDIERFKQYIESEVATTPQTMRDERNGTG